MVKILGLKYCPRHVYYYLRFINTGFVKIFIHADFSLGMGCGTDE